MATLNSYELNGKKQSFANWISNLSPTETPFCSMTGKEAVNQTNFYWQTDRLAAPAPVGTGAGSHTWLEGSDAVEQSMELTSVHSNVTQILRRSLKISDTANVMANFGRGRELSYQMEKESVALKRDLEAILLSGQVKEGGSASVARKTAGFDALVSSAADTDTGIHMKMASSAGADLIDFDDIRQMTERMFIAGTDANVIMFHPKHAAFWAGLQTVGTNVKMFDGDEKVFSHYVSTYTDEFGRTYKLIPNRHMPEKKIYFFNPSDFTQMILRAPNKVQLGKEGNFDHWMIEMEIGLRLRDPHAAGILTLG